MLHIIVCKTSYFLLFLLEKWPIKIAQMFEKGDHQKVTGLLPSLLPADIFLHEIQLHV